MIADMHTRVQAHAVHDSTQNDDDDWKTPIKHLGQAKPGQFVLFEICCEENSSLFFAVDGRKGLVLG